jgi:predicted RNA-binding protein YlxR (DUF448 family)/ribosomal protein L7Ae-like RNA K-turn-binding protein
MSEAVIHNERVEQPEAGGPSRARTRSCVGCGERVDLLGPEASDLVRLVFGPDGTVCVDAHDGSFGRGAHVHGRGACLERAVKGGLARSAKARVTTLVNEAGAEPLSAQALALAIQRSMARRIEGLVTAAVRSRRLAHGADAVTSACRRGDAALVMVACDAAAAAELTEVRRAVSEGRAVAWGSKQLLGQMVTEKPRAAVPENGSDAGAPAVAVVAITSRQLAEALRHAVQLADACAAIAIGGPSKGGGRPRAGVTPAHPERAGAPAGTPVKRRGQRAFPSAAAGHAKNHRSDG